MSAPLTEFLSARFAEDEAAAMAAGGGAWSAVDGGVSDFESESWPVASTEVPGGVRGDRAVREHIARQSPARILADLEAKRAIVEDAQRAQRSIEQRGTGNPPTTSAINGHVIALRSVVRRLASVYADHPDYRPEWRP